MNKREQNKLANREAILTAALKVFWKHGYEAVTIRDIIRATHLASGTFYNYFPDKETLLKALVEERFTELTARLTQVRRNSRTLEHFLHGAYSTAFAEVAAHPDFYATIFRNEAIIRAFYSDAVMGVSVRALKADLTDAMKRGLLPEMDSDYLTAILFSAGYELARMLTERKDKDPQEAAAFATRLFLMGVQNAGHPKVSPLIRRGPITHGGSAR